MSDYPKKIESVNSILEEDSLGFTEPEKIALKNCWRIVKLKRPIFTLDVLYEFLTKYPKYFSFFVKRGRTEYNLQLIHSHPQEIFNKVDILIEESLNPIIFLSTLKDFHNTHRFLDYQAVHLMAIVLNNQLKVILKRYMSPTLDEALDKFCMGIVYSFESQDGNN